MPDRNNAGKKDWKDDYVSYEIIRKTPVQSHRKAPPRDTQLIDWPTLRILFAIVIFWNLLNLMADLAY